MKSYLIQRLEKPWKRAELLSNAFSFGGGLKNGGLSDEAMSILSSLWSYAYMGSAEFEFGALPKSLDYIVKNRKMYTCGAIYVVGHIHDWKKRKKVKNKGKVYYACKKEDESNVKDVINKFSDAVKHEYITKEHVGLAEAICENNGRNIGWHDIDNHFLFFTDKDIFDRFCMLFEIERPAQSIAATTAAGLPMMCEVEGCLETNGTDYVRIDGEIDPGWEEEPIYLCKKHAKKRTKSTHKK